MEKLFANPREDRINPWDHVIEILDPSGHMKHMWDPQRPDEVAEVKASFDRMRKEKGYIAHRVNPQTGEAGEVMHEFDPTAEKMIMMPASIGG